MQVMLDESNHPAILRYRKSERIKTILLIFLTGGACVFVLYVLLSVGDVFTLMVMSILFVCWFIMLLLPQVESLHCHGLPKGIILDEQGIHLPERSDIWHAVKKGKLPAVVPYRSVKMAGILYSKGKPDLLFLIISSPHKNKSLFFLVGKEVINLDKIISILIDNGVNVLRWRETFFDLPEMVATKRE